MSSITLKDIPHNLHEALKKQAHHHGRSLNREIIDILQRTLTSQSVDVDTLTRRAQAAREEAGLYVTRTDLARQKEQGRA